MQGWFNPANTLPFPSAAVWREGKRKGSVAKIFYVNQKHIHAKCQIYTQGGTANTKTTVPPAGVGIGHSQHARSSVDG